MSTAPFVSVIVPCRNESAYLGACLDSILDCGYPRDRMEVLVADGMSRDGTRELARSYAARDTRVRCIDNPRQITPAALNRGIEESRGDVIVRLDAHSTVSPGYLTRAVECLESSGASNVGGVMHTVTRDSGPFAEPIRFTLTSRFGVGNSHFRTGSGSSSEARRVDTVFGGCWRREVFERIGSFNEFLERSQDIEFNLRLRRAGGTILLTPGMECRYYARATLLSFLRHNWDNGVWAVLPFAYAQGIPVRLRHLVPLAFVSAAGAATLAALLWHGLAWVPALAWAPYMAVNLLVSWTAAWKQRQPGFALLLPLSFAALHLGYGAGSLWGVARLFSILARRGTAS
ncbi:MAG TPA: glycosyltransferase family 2 protein [Bryobacteraceae bacterium]